MTEKVRDTKNKLLINELVKKYFSLNKKSQKLFTHRLFYEKDIPKEYSKILSGSEDFRFRKELNLNELASIDTSWEKFQKNFSFYIKKRNLVYDNYLENKITVKKNKKKLIKDISDFYTDNFLKIINFPEKNTDFLIEFNNNANLRFVLKDIFYSISHFISVLIKEKTGEGFVVSDFLQEEDILKKLNFVLYDESFKDYDIEIYLNLYKEKKSKKIKEIFNDEKSLIDFKKKIFKEISDFIESKFRNIFKEIIESKIFTKEKKMELVISLNYADWFLSSTSESWSSCISLSSTYSECFWLGIPQLIGDKSRAMVYITEKGGDKKEFEGIEVDRFYLRSWMQLYRVLPSEEPSEVDNKTFFYLNKSYPAIEENLYKIVEKIMEVPSYEKILNKYTIKKTPISRYYSENFWFQKNINNKETMTTIYLDMGNYKIAKKNKAFLFYGDYGYYKLTNSGRSSYYKSIDENKIGSEFKDILKNGVSFSEIVEIDSSVIEQTNYYLTYDEDYEEEDYDEDYDEEDYDEEIV